MTQVGTDCPINLERWMTELPDYLKEKPLINLCIPGSHNSLSYSISKSSDLSPDAPPIAHNLGRWARPIVNRIVYAWSRTQSIDISRQLHLGVRYLDIRLASRGGNLFAVHGLYGSVINAILEQLEIFLLHHSREFVILDFQHFYNFTSEDHASLLSLLNQTFQDKICSATYPINQVTLSMAQKTNKQVLIIYRHYVASENSGIVWPSECWPTPWPNKVKVNELISFLHSQLQHRNEKKGFVTQCILTVDTRYIVFHILSNLLGLAKATNNKILMWLEKQKEFNVALFDFVDRYNFSQRVVMLNFQSNTPTVPSLNMPMSDINLDHKNE